MLIFLLFSYLNCWSLVDCAQSYSPLLSANVLIFLSLHMLNGSHNSYLYVVFVQSAFRCFTLHYLHVAVNIQNFVRDCKMCAPDSVMFSSFCCTTGSSSESKTKDSKIIEVSVNLKNKWTLLWGEICSCTYLHILCWNSLQFSLNAASLLL